MSNGSTTWSYTYDANGMRTSRTDGTTAYSYVYNGSQLVQMVYAYNSTATTFNFYYDASGAPLSVNINGTDYYYVTNLQGDIVAILNTSGTKVVSYEYDAWGKLLDSEIVPASTTDVYLAFNPLRYRGYVFDLDTGLYYVGARYYEPEQGRFICADIPELLVSDFTDLKQHNLFTYCFNNPVNMADAAGTWPEWLEKAAAVVAVAAVVVAATAITVATYGAGSVAGVAMITATATLAAKTTEVVALQANKSASEGKSSDQIIKDSFESVYDNGVQIFGATPITKTAGIAFNHGLNSAVERIFGGTQTLDATLRSSGGKTVPYFFVAVAWTNTIISAFSDDPVARAVERGYNLK